MQALTGLRQQQSALPRTEVGSEFRNFSTLRIGKVIDTDLKKKKNERRDRLMKYRNIQVFSGNRWRFHGTSRCHFSLFILWFLPVSTWQL